jgi:phosphoglycerate dehydrogenase-like enzyme
VPGDKAGKPHSMAPVVHIIAPDDRPSLRAAVEEGGAELGPLAQADAVVVFRTSPGDLPELPDSVRWVQLPSAGVESWFAAGTIDHDRRWTSAGGVYARPVAEHCLALMMAGDREFGVFAQARSWDEDGRNRTRVLERLTVAIVGAGGIGRALIEMLQPFRVEILAVTRRGREVEGADRSFSAGQLDEVWPLAHHVVVAAPATNGTRHLVGAGELAAMRDDVWITNVARGSLIDTDALVQALRDGTVLGAGLDVTDPEPLPDGHPLWDFDNVIITPHLANPESVEEPLLAERVTENVRRFVAGEDLLAPIDPDAGY